MAYDFFKRQSEIHIDKKKNTTEPCGYEYILCNLK